MIAQIILTNFDNNLQNYIFKSNNSLRVLNKINKVYDSLSDEELILEQTSNFIINPENFYLKVFNYLYFGFLLFSSIPDSYLIAFNIKLNWIKLVFDFLKSVAFGFGVCY